jgi:hypothetical protein
MTDLYPLFSFDTCTEAYFEAHKSHEANLHAVPNQENAFKNQDSDQWAREVNYRCALRKQQTTWAECLPALQELFESAKSAETLRRINVREFCAVFREQQQAVFQTAEQAHQLPIEDWMARETNREEMEKEILDSIDKLVAQSMKSNDPIASDGNGSEMKDEVTYHQPSSDRVSVLGFYEDLFTVSLESDFCTSASVVEVIKKGDKLGDKLVRSNMALAVITSDSMLHLFSVNSQKVKHDMSPKETFTQVLESAQKECEMSGTFKDFSLRPSQSIDIQSISVAMSAHGNMVEISSRPSAVSQMVPMSLRTGSAREQMTMINAILGQGRRDSLVPDNISLASSYASDDNSSQFSSHSSSVN